jgi:hypothetical protein
VTKTCEHVVQSPYGIAIAGSATCSFSPCPWCEIKALSLKLDAITKAGWRSCIDHIIRPDSPCPVCALATAEARLSKASKAMEAWMNANYDAEEDTAIKELNEALAPAVEQRGCICPGWCFFNPGQHHENCKCTATIHCGVVEKHAHNWQEKPGDDQNLYCGCGAVSPPLFDPGQFALNGGSYCYHVEGGKYCGRAEMWPGHGESDLHDFVKKPS